MIPVFRISLLVIILSALSSACAEKAVPLPHPPPPPVVAAPSPAPAPGPDQIYRESGTAAWYGKELQGKKTASGEMFDMNALSAAHRTLPLGTIIRVTNLENFKNVKVKINDRGPFIRNRVLNLSLGAARELGFVDQGVARVKIETLESVRDSAQYTVNAAIFSDEENARMLKERLMKKFEGVSIMPLETNLARFYCVRVGAYGSEERAEQVAGKLMREGLEPFVVRKD